VAAAGAQQKGLLAALVALAAAVLVVIQTEHLELQTPEVVVVVLRETRHLLLALVAPALSSSECPTTFPLHSLRV
jgi:hypothetical protein